MSLLSSVNALKANFEKANEIVAALNPLKEEFDTQMVPLEGLDRSKVYFGINEDGTATIIAFDASNGAPRFNTAEPLPEAVTGESVVVLPAPEAAE